MIPMAKGYRYNNASSGNSWSRNRSFSTNHMIPR